MTIKHAEDCNCRDCALRRNEPTTETCDSCGKRRLCIRVSTDALTNKIVAWSPHYCVKECLGLTEEQRGARRAIARAEIKQGIRIDLARENVKAANAQLVQEQMVLREILRAKKRW